MSGEDVADAPAQELIAELRLIRQELSAISKALTARVRPETESRILSFREAARRLQVDRGSTLPELIKSGQLRTVLVNGKRKIPAYEVERLAEAGFDIHSPRPMLSRVGRRRSTRRSGSAGDAIRALKVK